MDFKNSFYYDPQRQGYDTNLWKSLSGTPTIVSDKLRVSNAEAIQYADCFRGYFSFAVNVPATPTNAYLTGGSSATAVVATWKAVTDGSFTISINGVEADITGLDFSAAADMDGVAAIIQAALVEEYGAVVTCVWDTDHFIITAGNAITVTSAVGSGTDVSGAGATAFMDSDTGHGTVTDATNTNKKFGLAQLNKDLDCFFELRGADLFAVTVDEKGLSQETKILWDDTNWTATDIKFEIDITGAVAIFKVNSGKVAHHESVVPRGPLSLYVYNGLADNLDFSYFQGQDIESLV